MADLLRLTVPEDLAGMRLDRAVARLTQQSRAYVKELIAAGHVTASGRREAGTYLVAAGELLEVDLAPRHTMRGDGGSELPQLRVLLEDEHLLAIDKPPGMASHPGGSEHWGTVSQAAQAHCGHALPSFEDADRPGIVHRLDKDTSGVMVVAKTELALAGLAGQFRERTVEKEYRAIVLGEPRFVSDWIERPIARDPKNPERMRVVRENGREAATYWEVVERFAGFAHVLCRPRTGRTHQVRVHMSAVRLPLVGDAVYRPRGMQGLALPPGAPEPGRHCLHARALTFRHPATGASITAEAPVPDDMARLLGWLREHMRARQ